MCMIKFTRMLLIDLDQGKAPRLVANHSALFLHTIARFLPYIPIDAQFHFTTLLVGCISGIDWYLVNKFETLVTESDRSTSPLYSGTNHQTLS